MMVITNEEAERGMTNYEYERVQVFTAVKIEVEFLWVLKPCSGVAGYQHCYLTITLHGFRTQKTST
jgi:hypothetical protein